MLWFFISLACILVWTGWGLKAHGAKLPEKLEMNRLLELVDTKEEASAALGILGLVIFLSGYIYLYHHFDYKALVNDFYANVAVDLLSIAITVLVLDRLNQRRVENREQTEKQHILTQIGSANNDFSLEAVKLADRNGWVTDGSLQNLDLSGANLEGAYLAHARLNNTNFQNSRLYRADLSNADLSEAILDNADLTRAILRTANLRGASFRNAVLNGTDLKGALYDSNTVWPRDFDAKIAGAVTEHISTQDIHLLNEVQRQLQSILTMLYDTAARARQIAYDAGLDISFINFQGSAQDIWRSILDEARITQKIGQLIHIAIYDYPERKNDLQAIWENYQNASQGDRSTNMHLN